MRRAFLLLIALLLAASIALAAQPIEGKIERVDTAKNVVTLTDGTQLAIPPDLMVLRDAFKKGATVRATYVEKGGQKVVTSIVVRMEKGS